MNYKKEIEQTMNSLDGLGQAKAPDSFMDDLQVRIDQTNNRFSIPLPFLKIAAIILFVLNLSILYPMGLLNFSEKEMTSNLNEEYFSDFSLDIDAYSELAENEK